MKTNNETKVKKVNLLRDVFSYPLKSSEKIEKDEMIVHERNKITYTGFTALTAIIILFGIFADTFDWEQMISLSILTLVGLVKYIMLIAFCKKGIVLGMSQDS